MNIENIILNSNYWLFLTTKKSFSKKVYTSFNGKKEKCIITKKAFKKGYLVEINNNREIRVKNDRELYKTLIIEGK